MNERFESLMYHAGMTAQGCWDEMDSYQREAVAKFAELIVRECVDICYNHPARMPSNNWQGVTVPLDIAQRLEEHFGVEL